MSDKRKYIQITFGKGDEANMSDVRIRCLPGWLRLGVGEEGWDTMSLPRSELSQDGEYLVCGAWHMAGFTDRV